MKKDSITLAKAIGIILMVIGHSGCYVRLHNFIYMFHMPLFFFVSGFCFKEMYLNRGGHFIKRRIDGLYIPFVKWNILFILLHNTFYTLDIYNSETYFFSHSHLYTLQEIVIHIYNIVIRMYDSEQLLGGFWFLKVLLHGSIISLLVIKYIRNIRISALVIFVVVLLTKITGLHIPYFGVGHLSFLGAFLFVIGYIFAKYNIHTFSYKVILFSFFIIFTSSFIWYSEMGKCTISSIVPYTLTAILGIWTIYSLCCKLTMSGKDSFCFKILRFIGENTLEVLTWHFVCFKIVSLIIIYIYDLPHIKLAAFPVIIEYAENGWWGVYAFIGLFVPLIVCFFRSRIQKMWNYNGNL